MRISTLPSIAIVLALSAGCVTIPERENVWTDPELRVSQEPAARPRAPLEPPDLPEGSLEGSRLYFTESEISLFEDFVNTADVNHTIASGNYRIGTELAGAVDELTRSHNRLVDMGATEHEIAESRRIRLIESERARLMDKILYGALAFLGIGAAVAD